MAEGASKSAPVIFRAWGWWRDMRLADVIVEDASFLMFDNIGMGSHRLEQVSIQSLPPAASEP